MTPPWPSLISIQLVELTTECHKLGTLREGRRYDPFNGLREDSPNKLSL